MSRILNWPRGNPLPLWWRDADIVDHVDATIPYASITSASVRVCESTAAEPPALLPDRVAVSVARNTDGEWLPFVAYSEDLDDRDQVRIVVQIETSGQTYRALDATARFTAATGA